MPKEAVDLVNKLLQLDPTERLGYGTKDSNLDFNALKSHNFFDGLDFKKIKNIAPPIPAA